MLRSRLFRGKSRLSRLIKQPTPLGQVVLYQEPVPSMVPWEGVVGTIKSGAVHGKCESIISAKARKEKLSATTDDPSGGTCLLVGNVAILQSSGVS